MCCRARCVCDLGWHCSKDCMCVLYVSTVMSSQSVSCRGDFFFRVVLWCVLSRIGRHLKGALPLWQSKCLSVRLCAWRSLSSRAYSRWSKQAQQTSTSALHVSQHSRQTVRMFDFLSLFDPVVVRLSASPYLDVMHSAVCLTVSLSDRWD